MAEGLIARGIDVTLFAMADSITKGKIANVVEKVNQFNIVHNHFDFLPLTYSGLIQTSVLTNRLGKN